MTETANLFDQLVAEFNSHYQMELVPDEDRRCAFLDDHGIYFQLEEKAEYQVVLTADICKVSSHDGAILLEALQLNTDPLLEGACLALAQDNSTLLLLYTPTKRTLYKLPAGEWLPAFVAKVRAIRDRLLTHKDKKAS